MIVPNSTYRADYANGRQLGSVEKFNRPTIASVVDDLGNLTTSAINQPRFSFNPVTLECRGLLIEPASTNLLTNSEFPNGLSDLTSVNGSAAITAFNEVANGISFSYTPGVNANAYKTYTPVVGTYYCFSVFVEMADGLAPSFLNYSTVNASTDFVLVMFGTSSEPPTVEHMGGKLYRVSGLRLGTTAGAPAGACGIAKYGGNSPRAFKVTAYQLEEAQAVSSYIKTLGTPVTRDASLLTVQPALLNKVIRSAEGTIFFDGVAGPSTGKHQVMISLDNGTPGDRITLYRSATNRAAYLANKDAVSITSSQFATPIVEGMRMKMAISFRKGRWIVAFNGQAVVIPGAAGADIPPYTTLQIGNYASILQWHGHIRAWEAHARPMTIEDLTELTK